MTKIRTNLPCLPAPPPPLAVRNCRRRKPCRYLTVAGLAFFRGLFPGFVAGAILFAAVDHIVLNLFLFARRSLFHAPGVGRRVSRHRKGAALNFDSSELHDLNGSARLSASIPSE